MATKTFTGKIERNALLAFLLDRCDKGTGVGTFIAGGLQEDEKLGAFRMGAFRKGTISWGLQISPGIIQVEINLEYEDPEEGNKG